MGLLELTKLFCINTKILSSRNFIFVSIKGVNHRWHNPKLQWDSDDKALSILLRV